MGSVLIVDDSRVVRRLGGAVLVRAGYIYLSDISPSTPVVISTSRTRVEISGLALSAAEGYVQKPWTANELLAELNRVGASPK